MPSFDMANCTFHYATSISPIRARCVTPFASVSRPRSRALHCNGSSFKGGVRRKEVTLCKATWLQEAFTKLFGGSAPPLHDSIATQSVSEDDKVLASLAMQLLPLGSALPSSASPAPNTKIPAAAAATAARHAGFLGMFAAVFEMYLKVLDGSLRAAHIPHSTGLSIVLLTLTVKLLTWPLSERQARATHGIQSLQPKVRALKERLRGNPAALQAQTAALYKAEGVNPLTSILSSLVTIPVFIGLYRALSNVAQDGLLSDGFLWIPSLAGPQGGITSWLKLGEDGRPPLGWHDTAAYLVLPLLLIASQYLTQRALQTPKQDDGAVKTSNKMVPLMIGWFALSVPSGMGLYWLTSNVMSAGQQLYFRRQFLKEDEMSASRTAERHRDAASPSRDQPDILAMPSTDEGEKPVAASYGRGRRFRALRQKEAEERVGPRGSSGVAVDTQEAPHVPDAPPPPNGKH